MLKVFKPRSRIRDEFGFGVIEILIVASIISVAFIGIVQLSVLSIRPIDASVRQAEAVALAEEAIEAVRVLRNESWSGNVVPLSDSTTYYPVISSGNWTLTATDPGPIRGTYTRGIVLSPVYRDGNDNISDSGTLDSETRKITATTTWSERGSDRTIVLETYLTNFLDN